MKLTEKYRGSGGRILIVEDDENVMEFTVRALKACGYTVYGARNAQETLRLFKQLEGKFDLVFCDIQLPDQSGVELIMKLIQIKPGLRVLLTSGYDCSQYDLTALLKKGIPFLEKPYPLTDLLRMIQDIAA